MKDYWGRLAQAEGSAAGVPANIAWFLLFNSLFPEESSTTARGKTQSC
jgi:hypothetical protein